MARLSLVETTNSRVCQFKLLQLEEVLPIRGQ
jgi:hypothetical protein